MSKKEQEQEIETAIWGFILELPSEEHILISEKNELYELVLKKIRRSK